MSPTPLIDLQRRLAEAGRIRMGEKTDRGAPKRLDTWRITSPTRALIEQASGLYGGEPQPWESPAGAQYEVVTATSDLPVLVMPGYSFRQSYEQRTSPTLVERRCDGVEMDNGTPCLCNQEGDDKCSLITRLTVALPELTTMLGWRLETKGENAARELLASMDLVQGVSGGRPFVPARLRIVERRGNVNGQAVRYVVPVIDVQLRYAELVGQDPHPDRPLGLPAGYTPIPERTGNGVALADGIIDAETQQLARKPRVPLPEDDSILDDEPTTTVTVVKPTAAQLKKLNVLVGKLRDAGQITTEHLWAALAKERHVDVDTMIELLAGRDEAGLHWSPLRDSLTKTEASGLIDRLETKAKA